MGNMADLESKQNWIVEILEMMEMMSDNEFIPNDICMWGKSGPSSHHGGLEGP